MKRKIWTWISLVTIASLALVACGGGTEAEPTEVMAEPTEVMAEPTEAPPEPTEEMVEPAATLRIWADDTRTPILNGLAEQFLAEYNVEIVVEDLGRVQDIRTQAIIAIPAGEGPDIFIGVHDWLGGMVESGLVSPIDLGDKRDSFVESNLDAFTLGGELYGMPYSSENLGFFYNTDLVEDPPTTWEGVLDVARDLKAEGLVEYATAVATGPLYNALPIQTAFGGYIFGVDDTGSWNPDDVGLDSEGEIAAVAWMRAAVEEGLMPDLFDYETAHSLFETGQIPFLMAGPWALDRIRASGVPYAVAPFFPDDGVPFLGVQGFYVSAFSENQLLAEAFLTEFVATDAIMQELYETGNRPSSFKSILELTDDPDLKAMGEAGVNAMPMPNIPEMGSVWTAADNGITLAATGDQTPEEAMADAAQQIRNLILGALAGMINVPGTFQDVVGCGAEWDPACPSSALEEGDDGLFTATFDLPADDYEFKIALDGAWTVNYGSDGAQDGPNYALSLTADSTVMFTYNPETHLVEWTIE